MRTNRLFIQSVLLHSKEFSHHPFGLAKTQKQAGERELYSKKRQRPGGGL